MKATHTRRLTLFMLLVVLTVPPLSGESLTSSAEQKAVPPKPVTQQSPQTLDDLFAAVARQVPEFGGMFYGPDKQTLQVYLTAINREKVAGVQRAVVAVFGAEIIPKGGIKALKGPYGFLELKEWYDRIVGSVFSIPGVTFTDIDEAKNRLRIGIENKAIEARVVEQLAKLGIPREVGVIEVTRSVVTASRKEGGYQPASLTLHSKVRPTEGGHQIIRNDSFGGAYTLGFNALRGGSVTGFVTSSWATEIVWQQDGMSFFQAGPFDVAGTETVDPPGFLSPGFPCPKYTKCRYSFAAFVAYDQGVSSAQGAIARTTGLTTTSVYNITVDPASKFAIAGQPSQPYLVGLTLSKVGRRSGWTSGTIVSTCADHSFPPNNLALCQYSVVDVNTPVIADFTDFGAPVFRLRNFNHQGWEHVELYGMLWGVTYDLKQYYFSPIGGVSFQQTGIQSATDLGPLFYLNCNLTPVSPC